MKRTFLLAPVAAFVLVGCGGGHHQNTAPKPAKILSYTDPTGASDTWKLVKDTSSTDTHVVLNLVGPSDGTKYRGMGFTLQADTTQVKYGRLQDTEGNPAYYKDGGVFTDQRYSDGADYPPALQVGGIRDGKLMVGIFQKDDAFTSPTVPSLPKDCSKTVLQIAIDLDPALKALPGAVPFTVLKARVIPEDISTLDKRRPQDVTLNIGKLELK